MNEANTAIAQVYVKKSTEAAFTFAGATTTLKTAFTNGELFGMLTLEVEDTTVTGTNTIANSAAYVKTQIETALAGTSIVAAVTGPNESGVPVTSGTIYATALGTGRYFEVKLSLGDLESDLIFVYLKDSTT